MKYSVQYILFLIILFLAANCFVQKKAAGIKLTDENIKKYISAYKKIRKNAPDILKKVNDNPNEPKIGEKEFKTIEKSIKDSGLTDYPEFVILNAKIGSIFSLIQAQSGMTKFQNLQDSSNEMYADSFKEIQKQLNNPDVPEETKGELRKLMEDLKKDQTTLNETYKKNKKIANWILKKAEKITGFIVSEEDIAIVKRYEKEILAAYIGFDLPYESDGRLPKINLNID